MDSKGKFPGLSSGGSYGFSILQRGFVTCGYVGGLSTVTSQVWSFYPGTNTWQMELEFPGISRRFPVAFAVHNRGYFGTGTNGINLNDFWQYNPILQPSGMEELHTISWQLYPNPTSEVIFVHLNDEMDPNTYGELHDLSGKVWVHVPLMKGNNEINIQSLAPGIYFFSLLHNGVKTTKQINIL